MEKKCMKRFSQKQILRERTEAYENYGIALFSSFLHYYGKGMEPVEALKRAENFAAAKIRENGAANGFIDEREVEKLLGI